MVENRGILLISLDFELCWAARRRQRILQSGQEPSGIVAHRIVPRLLNLFAQYDIHATWATVGFLFAGSRDELIGMLPDIRPRYKNDQLSPFDHVKIIGKDEKSSPGYYGKSVIRKIIDCPGQEIGSHTFSHYHCLEDGQDADSFRADIDAATAAAQNCGVRLQSIVFPYNQVNPDYLPLCRELGFSSYRGNPHSWMYRKLGEDASLSKRALRLVDSHLRLSGHNCHNLTAIEASGLPHNVPASRYLRPYSTGLALFEKLKLNRICADLRWAATRGCVYHLWWHPSDFEFNLTENFAFLTAVLEYFSVLREEYGMETLNMAEVSQKSRECRRQAV